MESKLPALRGKIGTWTYYTSNLTFKQVGDIVKQVDGELHTAKNLNEQIQRAITNNFKEITKYIHSQEERFFNALVLAVYDGDPKWVEIELEYPNSGEAFYNLGFLSLNGHEKIFPVDGQHRVEGIKKSVSENKELEDETIPVVFIGHHNNKNGMERTRRLFTTLNRRAKPVATNDIIALEEDDVIAIITRRLLDSYQLFLDDRVIFSKQKAIPVENKNSLTSVITLYQCNLELLKVCLKEQSVKISYKEFLLRRPDDEFINSLYEFVITFWNSFENIREIEEFLLKEKDYAEEFRNSDGGCILFRPVGLQPLVQCILKLYVEQGISFTEITERINQLNLNIDSAPWRNIIWNASEKKMIMGSNNLVRNLFIYILTGKDILSNKEFNRLISGYAQKLNIEKEEANVLLEGLML